MNHPANNKIADEMAGGRKVSGNIAFHQTCISLSVVALLTHVTIFAGVENTAATVGKAHFSRRQPDERADVQFDSILLTKRI
jgi:hypothetical protein